jgi:SMC interacting uncharacterized protein involved in chromosome segregation
MSNGIDEQESQLVERLRTLEDEFEHQMRARGFEPAQAEVTALPSLLAKLYAEREKLRADLERLKADGEQTDQSE